MLSHPGETGSQSLGADVAGTLPDDSEGVVYLVPVCAAPLIAVLLALQITTDESDQALAVAASPHLYLVKKSDPFLLVHSRASAPG